MAGTLFRRLLIAVFRNAVYSSGDGGEFSAERIYMVTTAIRAGIRFASNVGAGVVVSFVAGAERRRARFLAGVPELFSFPLMVLKTVDTPVKTCGAAAGVFNALHSVRITVIIHSGSSLDATLARFAVDLGVRVFEGVGLLGVGFAEVVRDFFGVSGSVGSACLFVASAVLR